MERIMLKIINQSFEKLFKKKQKHNEVHSQDPYLQKLSSLPACTEVMFNGNKSIEYRLDDYSYASIDRHPGIYRVVQPELTSEELEIIQGLRKRILRRVFDSNNGELEKKIFKLMEELAIEVSAHSKSRIIYYLLRDFSGYGIIDPFIKDAHIEDISCNGVCAPIYVQHRYIGSIKTNLSFKDESTLDNFVAKIALRCGKSISVAKPIIDAGLPDGNRINLTYGKEVTQKGSTFTIRKFKTSVISPAELIQQGTVSPEMLAYLWTLIEHRSSIMVFGMTGCGKTTLLNAFSLFIPPEAKIVSIEDTPEIRLPHENWTQLITRTSFSGEEAEITMFDLLKASLRQRPDYMIVGEIRGDEAKTLFQAISTGHLALSTIHAASGEDVIDRFTSPPMNIPVSLISNLGCLCHQITVHGKDGSLVRRTKSIIEIIKKGDGVELKTVFKWNPQAGFEYYENSRLERARKVGLGWESHQLASIAMREGLEVKDIEEEMKQKALMLKEMAENNTHNVLL
jgi:flagellar protein FlaI